MLFRSGSVKIELATQGSWKESDHWVVSGELVGAIPFKSLRDSKCSTLKEVELVQVPKRLAQVGKNDKVCNSIFKCVVGHPSKVLDVFDNASNNILNFILWYLLTYTSCCDVMNVVSFHVGPSVLNHNVDDKLGIEGHHPVLEVAADIDVYNDFKVLTIKMTS